MSLFSMLKFVLGDVTVAPLSGALGTLGIVLLIIGCVDVFNAGDKKGEAAASFGKKVVAYLVFLVLSHRLDEMAVDRMFDWRGSTQYLVAMGLSVREGLPVLRKIGQWAGVLPPEVLTARLTKMEQGQVSDNYVDARDLDSKIQNLKENLDKIKEYNRLKREAEGYIAGSEHSSAPEQSEPSSAPVDSGPTGPTM